MKLKTSIRALLFLSLAGAFAVRSALAQGTTLEQKTDVTISAPMQIPSGVLQPGHYTFQINTLPSGQTSVIQVRDDSGKVIANLMTINDYRLPTDKTVITYSERAENQPPAVRAWFYPGETFGHEFAYPRTEATLLADTNNVDVPSIPDTASGDMSTAQVTTIAPDTTPAPPAPVQEAVSQPVASSTPAASDTGNTQVAMNQPLPKTASSTYSIASFGVLALGMAGVLGIARRRIFSAERPSL
jgi:LPXTG-motif cell wall-anchored protein